MDREQNPKTFIPVSSSFASPPTSAQSNSSNVEKRWPILDSVAQQLEDAGRSETSIRETELLEPRAKATPVLLADHSAAPPSAGRAASPPPSLVLRRPETQAPPLDPPESTPLKDFLRRIAQ